MHALKDLDAWTLVVEMVLQAVQMAEADMIQESTTVQVCAVVIVLLKVCNTGFDWIVASYLLRSRRYVAKNLSGHAAQERVAMKVV